MPARHPVGDQALEPLHLGPHHRGERIGAVRAQSVADQPLGRRDAGHGGVDLVQPGPVLAEPELEGVQPLAQVLDLLLLRLDGLVQHHGGGAGEQYGAEQAAGQRHRPDHRRPQPEQQHPGRDPGPRPVRELPQPEDGGREDAGQNLRRGREDPAVRHEGERRQQRREQE